MKYIRRFLSFWYRFIVGDDWKIAAGVVVGLSLVALLVHGSHINSWWLLPVIMVGMLTLSLWIATRRQ
jgi:hypothetical protein